MVVVTSRRSSPCHILMCSVIPESPCLNWVKACGFWYFLVSSRSDAWPWKELLSG